MDFLLAYPIIQVGPNISKDQTQTWLILLVDETRNGTPIQRCPVIKCILLVLYLFAKEVANELAMWMTE